MMEESGVGISENRRMVSKKCMKTSLWKNDVRVSKETLDF